MNILKKIPNKIWTIIILSYLIPFLIDYFHIAEGIREMRWFFYVIPAFFFAYYIGLRGGIISSFLSNSFFLLWELGEKIFATEIHPEWETYLIFAISLVNFSVAIGIGILANKLNFLSITDPLTNLYNRRYINNYQLNKKKATILFIDIDRFKLINDSLGHGIGDKLLQSISERLVGLAGDTDIVARLGGDEFVFVMSEVKIGPIIDKAKVILNTLSKPNIIEGNELYLTASIGISQSPIHGEELNGLIAKADIAMYRAKQQGKNQYQFFSEEMNDEINEKLEIEKNLHNALEKQELELYYQPRMDLRSNTIIGMEALLRWQHPHQGLIPPLKFVPIAEETGMIKPIGEWVLYTACKQNKEWQDAGFPPLRVSVNISVRQFENNLVDIVRDVLNQTELDPQFLELEITESLLMKNVEEVVEILHMLKMLGVYLSIDDFGTGYSSLNYLKRFPIDCLKIDRSFVNDVLTDASISSAIITLGHNLNMEVIAEGIEEPEQAYALLMKNCNHGQGFLFSPPIPKKQFENFLMVHSDHPGLTISECEGVWRK